MAKKSMTVGAAQSVLAARGLGTRDAALDALAALDAAKWGEAEREPSRQMNSARSHALLVNKIAHYNVDAIDADLAAAAKALFTAEDVRLLRTGG